MFSFNIVFFKSGFRSLFVCRLNCRHRRSHIRHNFQVFNVAFDYDFQHYFLLRCTIVYCSWVSPLARSLTRPLALFLATAEEAIKKEQTSREEKDNIDLINVIWTFYSSSFLVVFLFRSPVFRCLFSY